MGFYKSKPYVLIYIYIYMNIFEKYEMEKGKICTLSAG